MKLILLLLVLSILSCTPKEVSLYEYKGVAVTRVDQGNKVYFYYGKYLDGNYPDNYIWTEYHGIDGAMSGYLIFNHDKTVDFVRLGSYFENNNAKSMRIKTFEPDIKYYDWSDSLKDSKNIIYVCTPAKFEVSGNKAENSKVKATYQIE